MNETPSDYLTPNWDEYRKIHGWRNYISDEIRLAWDTFTPEQKAMLARQAESLASNEEWD